MTSQLLTDNSTDTGVWEVAPDNCVRLVGALTQEGKLLTFDPAHQGFALPRSFVEKNWGPLENWLHEISA